MPSNPQRPCQTVSFDPPISLRYQLTTHGQVNHTPNSSFGLVGIEDLVDGRPIGQVYLEEVDLGDLSSELLFQPRSYLSTISRARERERIYIQVGSRCSPRFFTGDLLYPLDTSLGLGVVSVVDDDRQVFPSPQELEEDVAA